MAQRGAPSLVDQFRAPKLAAPLPPISPAASSPSAAAGVEVAAPPPAPSTSKPGVNGWFKENWGKAIAITLVVVITTIFVARTVLVARNKKRAKKEESKAAAAGVEWESFLEDAPKPVPPMIQRPRPMAPPFHPQHQFPHAGGPFPMTALPPPPPGMTPLPPAPPGMTPLPPMPQPVRNNGDGEGRGMVMRMPPAEGVHGGVPSVSMMPESTRPLRAAGGAGQGETFTIQEVPVVAVPDKEVDEPLTQEKEAPMIPPDIDVPNAKGTEHTRL